VTIPNHHHPEINAHRRPQRWFLYILECSDRSLYTGITNDVDARLIKHNAGKGARYTRGRLPVRLLFSEPCAGKSMALKREYAVKRLRRREKLALAARSGVFINALRER